MLAYIIINKTIKRNIFPLCLQLFGYIFCLSITMGRVGFGLHQGLSSRYTTFSLFIVIGLLLMFYNEFLNDVSFSSLSNKKY
jgi:ACR3 family arsenite efflux pump ArsB